MNKGIAGLVLAGAMVVSSTAQASTFGIYKFTGPTQTLASAMTVCRYSEGVPTSDDGEASYSVTVSSLTATEKTRLQTGIANGSAVINMRVLEQLNVISDGYVSLTYDYEIRFVRGTTITTIETDSVFLEATSGTSAPRREIAANLAAAGVPSTLEDTDRFEVVFHGSVDNVCGSVWSQVGSATYLSNVYGTAKATFTGTY
jgi:hypothetical protein